MILIMSRIHVLVTLDINRRSTRSLRSYQRKKQSREKRPDRGGILLPSSILPKATSKAQPPQALWFINYTGQLLESLYPQVHTYLLLY